MLLDGRFGSKNISQRFKLVFENILDRLRTLQIGPLVVHSGTDVVVNRDVRCVEIFGGLGEVLGLSSVL